MKKNITLTLNNRLAAETIVNNAPTIKGCKYCAIPTALLELDEVIQRPARGHEHAIARNWDDAKCDDLKVNYASETGKFTVIDGQHRYLAAKEAGIETLVCRVYIDLDQKARANLFVAQSDNVRKLTTRDVFKANLVAENPTAIGLNNFIREYGFYVFPKSEVERPVLKCIQVLWRVYRVHGDEAVRFYFDLLKESGWRDDPKATSVTFSTAIIKLWRWKARYTNEQLAYLPKLLAATTPNELKANAVLMFPRGTVDSAISRYIEYRITHDQLAAETTAADETETANDPAAVILPEPNVG